MDRQIGAAIERIGQLHIKEIHAHDIREAVEQLIRIARIVLYERPDRIRHVHQHVGIAGSPVIAGHVLQYDPGVASVCVGIAATESAPEREIDVIGRSALVDHREVSSLPHGALEICPDVAGAGQRHVCDRVLVRLEHDAQRFIQAQHVNDAVLQLLIGQRRPGEAPDRIVQLSLLMLDAHLLQELAQAHVRQTVAAAELKPAADLALGHLPACQTENLVRLKIMDRAQKLKLV